MKRKEQILNEIRMIQDEVVEMATLPASVDMVNKLKKLVKQIKHLRKQLTELN